MQQQLLVEELLVVAPVTVTWGVRGGEGRGFNGGGAPRLVEELLWLSHVLRKSLPVRLFPTNDLPAIGEWERLSLNSLPIEAFRFSSK